jgi:hypothetical protein
MGEDNGMMKTYTAIIACLFVVGCQTTQRPNLNVSETDAPIAKLLYDRCMSSAYEGAAKSKFSDKELMQMCKCTTPIFLKFMKPDLKEAMRNRTPYNGSGTVYTDEDVFEVEIRRKCPSAASIAR